MDMSDKLPGSFRSLIDRHKRLSRVIRCKELIEAFVTRGLDTRVRRASTERMQLARKCVALIHHIRRYRYLGWSDVFRLLHVDPSEDILSDITAEVLNPRRNVAGRRILSLLLRKHAPEIGQLFDSADTSQIHVRREVSGSCSRIDLRIWTEGIPDGDAAIDFEFKIDGGRETVHPRTGKPQTIREWDNLLEFAIAQGIAEFNVVAFFVTSSGEPPASRTFRPLARAELHEYITAALSEEYCQQVAEPDRRAAIGALHWFFLSPHIN